MLKQIMVCGGVAVLCFGSWRAFEWPIDRSKVRAIQPGMSPQQVQGILGQPSRVLIGGQWTYTRFLTFGYVNVLFDTNGLVLYANREEF